MSLTQDLALRKKNWTAFRILSEKISVVMKGVKFNENIIYFSKY